MGRKKAPTREEIVAKLRQAEVLAGRGKTVADAVRAIGVIEPTYYRWRTQIGGRKPNYAERLEDSHAGWCSRASTKDGGSVRRASSLRLRVRGPEASLAVGGRSQRRRPGRPKVSCPPLSVRPPIETPHEHPCLARSFHEGDRPLNRLRSLWRLADAFWANLPIHGSVAAFFVLRSNE